MEHDVKTAKWHGIDGIVVSELRERVEEALGVERLIETLDAIARHIRLLVGTHQSAVSYIPDGDFSRAVHGISLSEKYEKYTTYDVLPTGKGIWAVIFERTEPMCMTEAEVYAHPRFLNFSDLKDERGLEHPPLRGWLAVPVIRRTGEAIGVLQLSDRIEGDFTPEDQATLENATALIAPTMEAEYFHEQVTLRKEELERANEELAQAHEDLKAQRRAALSLAQDAEEARDGLARANEALEQSNIELQQFAYIASHDLQSPLRAIAGFAQCLQNEYQGRLDDEADVYIERIIGGSKRMQQLISDLLSYSRVESRAVPFKPTDLNEVFNGVLELLRASIEDAAGEVTRDELPVVPGDPSQLSQLLQNLIGNGIKYHADQPPRLHVWAERNGNDWTIAVRDNGIGIAAEQHEKIFEIFRRLHTQQAYPGTGIGLAICRRIVSRHGGRIWLESEDGKGSTFYFTIAAQGGEASAHLAQHGGETQREVFL